MSSFKESNYQISIRSNMKSEQLETNMDDQKEYSIVFHKVEYTNKEKLAVQ